MSNYAVLGEQRLSNGEIFPGVKDEATLLAGNFEKYEINHDVVSAIEAGFEGMSRSSGSGFWRKEWMDTTWQGLTAIFKAGNFKVVPYVFRLEESYTYNNACNTTTHGPIMWNNGGFFGSFNSISLYDENDTSLGTGSATCGSTYSGIQQSVNVSTLFNNLQVKDDNDEQGTWYRKFKLAPAGCGVVVLPVFGTLKGIQETGTNIILNDISYHHGNYNSDPDVNYMITGSLIEDWTWGQLSSWQDGKHGEDVFIKSFNTYKIHNNDSETSSDNQRQATGSIKNGETKYTGKSVFVFFVETYCQDGYDNKQLWCFNILSLLNQGGIGGTDGKQAQGGTVNDFMTDFNDRFFTGFFTYWGEITYITGSKGFTGNFIPLPWYMKNNSGYFNDTKTRIVSGCEEGITIGDISNSSCVPFQNGARMLSSDPYALTEFLNNGLGLVSTPDENEARSVPVNEWWHPENIPDINDNLPGQSDGSIGGNADFGNINEEYDNITGESNATGYNLSTNCWLLTETNAKNLQRALVDPDTWGSISNIFKNNPQEGIISLNKFPINFDNIIPDSVSDRNVSILGVDIGDLAGAPVVGISQPSLMRSRFEVGSFTFNERFGCFLDYAPFTKITMYLPFIGFKDISANDVMRRKVKIVYDVDYNDGSCKCLLLVSNDYNGSTQENFTPLYMYDGNIAQPIPLQSSDKETRIQENTKTAITAAAGIVATIATSGAGASALLPAATQALQSGTDILSNKPHYRAGGTTDGQSSYAVNNLQPFVVIEYPDTNMPYELRHVYGFACNYYTKLTGLKGMTQCQNVRVAIENATETEKEEIKALLEGGINIL